MSRNAPPSTAKPPWSARVAVHDVPEAGRRFDLVADESTRAAVAESIGLRALPRLEASFDVSRQGREGLHVAGRVIATVGQTCVVSLDPIDNELDEVVDLVFQPASEEEQEEPQDGRRSRVAADDAPEPLVGGAVDLGAVATEYLALGIDPHPRKPDAKFSAPAADDDSPHPFAALAALKKEQGGS
jgi:uncharacterized metal-binding protein YceD (DUF177 family)